MFHAQDGLFFDRNSEGKIEIIVDTKDCKFHTKLDDDTFASAICHVSEREVTKAHHEVAVAMLKGH